MSAASSFFADVQAAKRLRANCPSPALLMTRDTDVLPDAARRALDAHLASCAWCRALRDDLASIEQDEIHADERARIDARVFAGIAAAKQPAPVTTPARRWALPSWTAAAALAATLLVAAAVTLRPGTPVAATPPSAPALRVASFTPPSALRLDAPPVALSLETALVWRGAAATADNDATAGASAFARGDYAAAYDRLRRVPGDAASSDSLLYLGVSALFLNKDGEAADALARARTRATPRDHAAIDWYSSLTDVRAGRRDQARAALVRVCESESDYSLRACAAVLELDRAR